jgi:uncharacterized membrane protein YfcA
MELCVAFLGFFVGVMVGLTGIGGAALMAPLLIVVVGVRPVVAVGTDLAYGAITKVVGAWVHWRQGTVRWAIVGRLALGSVPGSILGMSALYYLHGVGSGPDEYVRRAIGAVLIFIAVVIFAQAKWGNRFSLSGNCDKRVGLATVIWGAVVGFTVALTSIGSGSLIVPFLLLAYPLNPAEAVGTDVVHASILVSLTAALHGNLGTVDWRSVWLLLVGSVPGVVLGSLLAPRMPTPLLRVVLAAAVLASGMKLV